MPVNQNGFLSVRGIWALVILLFALLIWVAIGTTAFFVTRSLTKGQDAAVQSATDVTANSVQTEQDAAQEPIVLVYRADTSALNNQLQGLKDDISKLPPSANTDLDPDLSRVVLIGLCRDKARSDSPDCGAYRENPQ